MDAIFKSLVEQATTWLRPLHREDFARWLLRHYRSLHDDGECAGILCPYCAFDEYQTVKEKK